MSRTGNQLLASLSKYIGDQDFPEGLETTAAGSSTSLVDTILGREGDDYFIDWYIRITENVNGNQYLARRISDFVGSSGTCTVVPAFAGGTASGTTYELHRVAPHEKFSALDEARITCYPALGVLVYNDTLTGDGIQRTFDIPSAIRRGPIQVYIEKPVSSSAVSWNFLKGPLGDATTGYTATGTTASTYSQNTNDRIIPKLGYTCTKLVTTASQAATYNMLIASAVNSLTAALAADRKMTHARWVYCTEASKVRTGITDDVGTTYGSYHGGGGWELLTAERTIAGNNATTLTAVLDIASTANASTMYAERGWFYFGAAEKVTEFWRPISQENIRRDDTTQQFTLNFTPTRGYQLRLVGRALLTALGDVAATQATNTMEVDEAESELLAAEAAKVLFRRGVLSSGMMEGVAQQMALNEATLKQLKSKWQQSTPGPRITSFWAS